MGCVALSATTAVLNSTARGRREVARQGQAGAAGSGSPRPDSGAHAAGALALGCGQRERELGARLQVLHAESRRRRHVGVARAAVGVAHGVAKRVPRDRGCVEIVDIVPQVMLRTIQRAYAAWSPTAAPARLSPGASRAPGTQ